MVSVQSDKINNFEPSPLVPVKPKLSDTSPSCKEPKAIRDDASEGKMQLGMSYGEEVIKEKLDSANDQLQIKTDFKDSMTPVTPDWSMFIKQQTLGQGAYGTVYKVKSLKTSMVLGGSEGVRVVLNSPTMRMKRKLNKKSMGSNMQSTIEKQNKVRSLLID